MYESVTYEVLLRRMLDRALESNKNLDSREGSILWLAEVPAAVELQNLYIALDNILKETFGDTASRTYLILRAKERGLSPQSATPAVLEMTAAPAELDLAVGTRFSIGDLNYAITARLGGGKYKLTCETAGEAGNDYAGAVIPIEYVDGLESCAITALLVPGEDDEDTEAFRQRYLDSLNVQPFGGNKADYIQKVNAIPGVGGVRVYRAWNGGLRPADMIPPAQTADWIASLPSIPAAVKAWLDAVYRAGSSSWLTVGGTVKLVIIDSTFSTPSAALVDQVQTAMDPLQNAGEGLGLAPIGHVVKVFPVESQTVNLSFSLACKSGWTWTDVEPYARETVSEYFQELAVSWAKQGETLTVRVSQIESRLLNTAGVLDIGNTAVNGTEGNYTLSLDAIPVLGGITARDMYG